MTLRPPPRQVSHAPQPAGVRRRARTRLVAVLGAAVLLTGCAGSGPRDSITAPVSPQAADIDGLWTLSLVLGVAVWVTVMALLAVPLVRSWRRHRTARRTPDAGVGSPTPGTDDGYATSPASGADDGHADGTAPADDGTDHLADAAAQAQAEEHEVRGVRRMVTVPPAAVLDEPVATADHLDVAAAQRDRRVRARLLWIGGIIGPAIILVVLLIVSGAVGASTAHVARDGELVIDVRGHMFWWEVHYPDADITTANEIHVPVDQPVRLRLTTEDVIHSFWIPRVHGKIDMIPGTENWLSFEATQTGRFRGQCAEFCGIAHAQMVAFLEVHEPDEFEEWVAREQQDAFEPTSASAVEGQRVFFAAGCASCHAVSGTDALGTVGPDLTHIASRSTLGAGIVPNTRERLRDLIVDPWKVKPGNPMPPTRLDDAELEALLDYLEVLQ